MLFILIINKIKFINVWTIVKFYYNIAMFIKYRWNMLKTDGTEIDIWHKYILNYIYWYSVLI